MKNIKCFILIVILAALLSAGIVFAQNNTTLEEHDFDSYFKMNVPKGISFEKIEGAQSKNINITLNYRNDSLKINVVYTQSIGAKNTLVKYYEEMAKNNTDMKMNSTGNTTIIHFNGKNIIGETNYHDMAIVGDNEKYILMQCDNETLMKSMAESVKFK